MPRPWTNALVPILVAAVAGHAASQRCDLVTSASKCLDLAGRNKATLTVSSSTTRIPSDGLVLCEIPGSTPPPTDIVYIVDQSESMKPTAILVDGEDTTGWYECGSSIMYSGSVPFHGNTVGVITAGTSVATIASACKVAGDPYSARGSAVYSALQTQASKSPGSYAATVNFNASITTTQDSMTQLDAAGLSALMTTVPVTTASGTKYKAPLEWARVLLYGGHSSTGTIQASPDAKKAVIFISDGQPSDTTKSNNWKDALKDTFSVKMTSGMVGSAYAGTWWGDSTNMPPVYGIYLGENDTGGSTLKKLSDTTGGTFFRIPPNKPDSLGRVIGTILGDLIPPAKPDTFLIRNLTNGQTSRATASSTAGANGYRMQLDSLVALESGANAIVLSVKTYINGVDSTITDTFYIDVAGSSTTTSGTLGLDTVVSTKCTAASSLALAPDVSGLAWCESVKSDKNVVATLTTVPGSYLSLPISFSTKVHADAEPLSIGIPASAVDTALAAFTGELSWGTPVGGGATGNNGVLQSGPGWDSAIATFQMPRDKRDTASARIALHRPVAPTLSMTTPVDGPSGTITVTVVDSNVTSGTVKVVVRHRLGDTIGLSLNKSSSYVYTATFSFLQGQSKNLADAILEMGALTSAIDSITGTYQDSISATTYVQPAVLKLRFVTSAGVVQDTLSFTEALGAKTSVTVAAYIGSELCTTCSWPLSIAVSDAGLGVQSTAGAAIASIELAAGKGEVYVKGLSPVLAGSLTFTSDSLNLSIAASPLTVTPPAPDSAVYLDVDGDGALDRVAVYLATPWTASQNYRLPWPDSARALDLSAAAISISPDAKVVTYDFTPGTSPDTTAAIWALHGSWRFSTGWGWQGFPIHERIAPVPLKAILTRGSIYDTLRIYPSEKLQALVAPWTSLVGRLVLGTLKDSLSPASARIEASSGALLVLIKSDSTSYQVRPGDSVRFLSSVKDSAGAAPGAKAKAVVVQGSDPAPKDAVIVDSDADGRADRVIVYLRTPLTVTDEIGFSWPDTNGVLQKQVLSPAFGAASASGDTLTFDLVPFPFGATSCPSSGCGDLGYIATSRFGTKANSFFPIRDGVDPIPTSAAYRYSDGTVSDTLVVTFSEPLKAAGTANWVSVGRPGLDSLGKLVAAVAPQLQERGREARLLVDSAFVGKSGDSLRITSSAIGALSDTSGNAPETLAYWAPLTWGKPPVKVTLGVPYPVVRSGTADAPSDESAITILTRPTSGDSWTAVEGTDPSGLDSRFGGVTVGLNRIPQTLGIYIYDNMGVLVLNRDLSSLAQLAADGTLARTARGDYEVWLAWDGKDGQGQPAASGVYFVRIYGWISDGGNTYMLNAIKTTGFYRKVK